MVGSHCACLVVVKLIVKPQPHPACPGWFLPHCATLPLSRRIHYIPTLRRLGRFSTLNILRFHGDELQFFVMLCCQCFAVDCL